MAAKRLLFKRPPSRILCSIQEGGFFWISHPPRFLSQANFLFVESMPFSVSFVFFFSIF